MKHRRALPFFIVFVLIIGMPDISYAIRNNWTGSLFSTIFLGCVVGYLLCLPCMRWIVKNQKDGKVTLGYIAEIVIILGWLGTASVVWLADNNIIRGYCKMLSVESPNDCISSLAIFSTFIDVSFFFVLYIWGIWYERKIGHRIIYFEPLLEHFKQN